MNYMLTRATRSFREDKRLLLATVSSLAVAFVFLGLCVLALYNVDKVAQRWATGGRLTVYLNQGAEPTRIAQIHGALRGVTEIAQVRFVSAQEASKAFEKSINLPEISQVSGKESLLPASFELTLKDIVTVAQKEALTERLKHLEGIADVDMYQGWMGKLRALISTIQNGTLFLALLVMLSVMAIVSSTIRLSISRRQKEIEVLELCGATRRFIRMPLLIEGAIHGTGAACLALCVVAGLSWVLRDSITTAFRALTGVAWQAPPLWMWGSMVVLGASLGAAASAMALKRYMRVS